MHKQQIPNPIKRALEAHSSRTGHKRFLVSLNRLECVECGKAAIFTMEGLRLKIRGGKHGINFRQIEPENF